MRVFYVPVEERVIAVKPSDTHHFVSVEVPGFDEILLEPDEARLLAKALKRSASEVEGRRDAFEGRFERIINRVESDG